MISSIFIVGGKSEILILRSYKDDVTRSEAQAFCSEVVATKELANCPIRTVGECHFIHIECQDIVLVCATKEDINACLVLKMMFQVLNLFKAYFGGQFNESLVRRNFVLIYELLDEVIDFGYPQIMDGDILKQYITQGGLKPADINNVFFLFRYN